MKLTAGLIALVLAAAALGACGDDDSDPEATTETTTSETTMEQTDFQPEPCPGAESPPNIVNVTSYGTDCAAVEDAMAELRSVGRQFRLGDFQCARVSGSRLSGTWECRGEASYFTFQFGD